MIPWLHDLDCMTRGGDGCVVVTVASARGSVPREPGAKLLVAGGAIRGTIGGGHLELKAIEIARHMLQQGGAAALHRFPLGAALGQCCGGIAELFFERVGARDASWREQLARLTQGSHTCVVATASGAGRPAKLLLAVAARIGSLGDEHLDLLAAQRAERMLQAEEDEAACLANLETATGEKRCVLFERVADPRFHVVLFGAGHVGRALVSVLQQVQCSIRWVDTRDDAFPDDVASNVAKQPTDAPEEEVDAAPPGSFFLVMTHSHALDFELAARILRRRDFAYFGLIGSATKRRQFERRLAQRGFAPADFARITCPIGVAGLNGKQPSTIAIAVAAQLIEFSERAGRRGASRSPTGPHRSWEGSAD